jgi:hypothetical protein
MKTTEQTLATAIGQLSLLSPDRPTSFDDLVALNAARDCIDELLRACVDELSTDPQTSALWSAVSSAIKLSSKPAPTKKQPHSSETVSSRADKRIRSFWREFAEHFAWDFLPMDFLHALYTQWMSAEFPKDAPLSKETFTRRLKVAAAASEGWSYSRSRPGCLMNAAEPLLDQVPNWTHDGSARAIYGLRRSGS